MSRKTHLFRSTVGKKLLMGITGLALVGFVVEHLSGNLLLLSSNPDHFNKYAHFLEGFGELLYVAEAGLVAFFLVHIITGIRVSLHNKGSRPQKYQKTRNAGGASRKSISSVSMIWTGLILFTFIALHLWHFKFGPNIEQGYVTQLGGEQARDLYRLVVESFRNPLIVGGYVFVMLLLGFHIRHGFWSAFQSLGAHHPRYTPLIYTAGVVLAIVLALGFVFIPIGIYVREVVL